MVEQRCTCRRRQYDPKLIQINLNTVICSVSKIACECNCRSVSACIVYENARNFTVIVSLILSRCANTRWPFWMNYYYLYNDAILTKWTWLHHTPIWNIHIILIITICKYMYENVYFIYSMGVTFIVNSFITTQVLLSFINPLNTKIIKFNWVVIISC